MTLGTINSRLGILHSLNQVIRKISNASDRHLQRKNSRAGCSRRTVLLNTVSFNGKHKIDIAVLSRYDADICRIIKILYCHLVQGLTCFRIEYRITRIGISHLHQYPQIIIFIAIIIYFSPFRNILDRCRKGFGFIGIGTAERDVKRNLHILESAGCIGLKSDDISYRGNTFCESQHGFSRHLNIGKTSVRIRIDGHGIDEEPDGRTVRSRIL